MQKLKNKKGEISSISLILFGFIIVVFGAITATIIAQQTSLNTEPTYVANEALSIATLRQAGNNINASNNVTLANLGLKDEGGWVLNSVSITNNSGTSLSGNFTVDYTNQKISFINNTFMISGGGARNDTLASYKYYQSNYMRQSFGRNVLGNILNGLYALFILVIIVGIIYVFLKKAQK